MYIALEPGLPVVTVNPLTEADEATGVPVIGTTGTKKSELGKGTEAGGVGVATWLEAPNEITVLPAGNPMREPILMMIPPIVKLTSSW